MHCEFKLYSLSPSKAGVNKQIIHYEFKLYSLFLSEAGGE